MKEYVSRHIYGRQYFTEMNLPKGRRMNWNTAFRCEFHPAVAGDIESFRKSSPAIVHQLGSLFELVTHLKPHELDDIALSRTDSLDGAEFFTIRHYVRGGVVIACVARRERKLLSLLFAFVDSEESIRLEIERALKRLKGYDWSAHRRRVS
jgi:hypothetical protein